MQKNYFPKIDDKTAFCINHATYTYQKNIFRDTTRYIWGNLPISHWHTCMVANSFIWRRYLSPRKPDTHAPSLTFSKSIDTDIPWRHIRSIFPFIFFNILKISHTSVTIEMSRTCACSTDSKSMLYGNIICQTTLVFMRMEDVVIASVTV
jgi:hypothetical protein